MSIIYDALKKVEKVYTEEKNPDIPKKKSLSRFGFYLIYAFIIAAGILSAKLIFGFFAKIAVNSKDISNSKARIQEKEPITSKPAKSTIQGIITKKITESIFNKDVTEPAAPSSFILTGIFFSNEEGFALINNKILKEGDAIEGATISKITLEDVELNLQGELIKLRTNSN